MDLPDAPAPSEVELDRDRALRVVWPDGTEAVFALDDLRDACPCAACRGRREQHLAVHDGAPGAVRATGAELVGNWGLSIVWADGHDTGIYPWSLLRAWVGTDHDGT